MTFVIIWLLSGLLAGLIIWRYHVSPDSRTLTVADYAGIIVTTFSGLYGFGAMLLICLASLFDRRKRRFRANRTPDSCIR